MIATSRCNRCEVHGEVAEHVGVFTGCTVGAMYVSLRALALHWLCIGFAFALHWQCIRTGSPVRSVDRAPPNRTGKIGAH